MIKGYGFAMLGGACLTLQALANAQIGQAIGPWQTAVVTQFTGCTVAFLIMWLAKDRSFRRLKEVKSLHLAGGALGPLIIGCNLTAIQHIGATMTISLLLLAQLSLTFLIERNGWFGIGKKKAGLPQLIGLLLMTSGVLILQF